MKIAITGGAGFIGSNLVSELLNSEITIDQLLIIDDLSYAGSLENIGVFLDDSRVKFVQKNICDNDSMRLILNDIDSIFHLAAESHVDNSIKNADPFWKTNVLGTVSLLEVIKNQRNTKFLHVSTDEVYGSVENGSFTELDMLWPSSPYSGSKAASDLACISYAKTFELNLNITRCSNNFGANQFPEKLIPVLVRQAMLNQPLTLYGNGRNIREWIPAKIHAKYLISIMFSDISNEIINIGSGIERTNLEIAYKIISTLNSKSEITFVQDRAGHDYRYSVDLTKLHSLVEPIEFDFESELEECILKTAERFLKSS